jgi:DNA polymerase-1
MNSRLVLVDGSSYLYRAFHALPPLNNSQGEPTGAIYGVIAMLRKLQKEVHPSTIAVIFDSPTPTFRHQLYPAYKANRLKMPEELQKQVSTLYAIIRAMGLPLINIAGVEADDIIGTLTQQAKQAGMQVLISTSDKDFAQLVDENVHLVNTMTGTVMDPAGIINRFGVEPCQIIDYLTLIGDTSDNVPGVPMVGPKTAVKWLTQYQTLEQLLENADKITGKVGNNLRAHREHLVLARQLITIKQDVPLNYPLEDLKPLNMDIDLLRDWFEKLEFKSWLKELSSSITKPSEPTHIDQNSFRDYELIVDETTLVKWKKAIEAAEWTVIDLETTGLDTLTAELVGIAVAIHPKQQAYIPLKHDTIGSPPQLDLNWVLMQLKPWLEDPLAKKVGHNLKYDRGILANYGIELAGTYADTLLESYLLDSASKNHDLESVAERYFNYRVISFEEIAGKGKQQLQFNQIPVEKAAPYAAEDAAVCYALHTLLEPQLKDKGGLVVRDQLEIPLIKILSRMERYGVFIDTQLLKQQSEELAIRLKALEEKSYVLAGQPFNLSSPKQLQEILYRTHQLPILSKTTTGQPSTSEKVLQALAVDHQLPELILEYRTLSKLKSTYTDALPRQVHPKTGRVHTAYHQAVVITGRLSSSNPNLQNIPIRTEEGRKIRRAFAAPPGYKIVAADYSQIELRIMAHFSQDEALLNAFQNNLDVHAATAVELFGITLDQVTSEQRRQAKVVNFGLIYGISAFGLATQLRTTPEVAQSIMDHYFTKYPGVKRYMEKTRQLAHTQGYVQTLLGRRLSLPLIHSQNKLHQKATERAAINAPLQGTAADIIKQAMINIDAQFEQHSIAAHMIMQVHDELVFEVREDKLEETCQCIEQNMKNAASLIVPLEVSIGIGNNWEEAH